jgi:hypothetical protein
MPFDFGVQGWIVRDGAIDGARVYEVEGRGAESPGLCEVIDLELEVGWDVGGLDWR